MIYQQQLSMLQLEGHYILRCCIFFSVCEEIFLRECGFSRDLFLRLQPGDSRHLVHPESPIELG
jgi:hypothetical protein